MSTLAETYALQIGVPLHKPSIYEAFYPLDHPVDKAILIHAFGGGIVDTPQGKQAAFMAKIYDQYSDVVAMLKPELEKAGYRFYQIGAPGEPPIKGVEQLTGRTSIHQCAYLVKRAALLIGNDSMWAHMRGSFGGSMVIAYGSTSKPHYPYWRDDAKTVLIESHRFGKKPSYQAVENPKTINLITPESIANAALRLLDLPQVATRSLSVGVAYNQHIVQLIPNVVVDPRTQFSMPPVIRMDLHFDESLFAQNLQLRRSMVITNREIDVNILARLRGNIESIRIEIDNLSADWIRKVRRLGVRCAFMAVEKDDAKVQQMRLDYYDVLQPTGFDRFIPPTLDDWKKDVAKYTNAPYDETTKVEELSFRTNTFILSDGKVYLSKAHWLAGTPTQSIEHNEGKVIDVPAYWEEAVGHHYIYRT